MASILILAKSNALQEALALVISSLPEVNGVAITGNVPAALAQFNGQCPHLIIGDGNLPRPDIEQLITQVKVERAQTKILFIANTFQQQQDLLMWGADSVLTRGIPINLILETVLGLIGDRID